MKELNKILMDKYDITLEESEELVEETREALLSGQEDAIGMYLGLEDDYIFDILG